MDIESIIVTVGGRKKPFIILSFTQKIGIDSLSQRLMTVLPLDL